MLSKGLIRKHKALARTLLYAAPVVIYLAFTWLSKVSPESAVDRSWEDVDFLEYESVRLLQEYLRIDTSYPDGSEIAGAEFLASILEKAGIETHIERLGERNANLWAEIPGERSEALVLHHHMDVIPALDEDGWRFGAFSGTIDPPFIYGRGAFDMKSVGIAQLMAMLDIARSGERPHRSLIYLGTGEEERDSYLGTQYLLRHHPELHKRFWTVLTEGGAVEAVNLEEARYWGTSFHQKRYVDIWVCDSDRRRLLELRESVDRNETPRRMYPALEQFFPHYARSRDRDESRRLLADPASMLDRIRTFPRDVDDTVVTPNVDWMLRSQVVAFPVEEAPGGGYLMRLILHLQSDLEVEDVWDALFGDALDGFTYQVEEVSGLSQGSRLDHEAFQTIDSVMARERPTIDHGPLSIAFSANDARFFRDYGIPAYGFTPFHILSTDTGGMKGVDERMGLPPFVEGVDLYLKLVAELIDDAPPLSEDPKTDT